MVVKRWGVAQEAAPFEKNDARFGKIDARFEKNEATFEKQVQPSSDGQSAHNSEIRQNTSHNSEVNREKIRMSC
jgi:hypothetical protein